jgi:hypothetical protein
LVRRRSVRLGTDVPADVEQSAFGAPLRTGLLFVIQRVEPLVFDDGAARQAFAEVRAPNGARLVVDQRARHKPQSTPPFRGFKSSLSCTNSGARYWDHSDRPVPTRQVPTSAVDVTGSAPLEPDAVWSTLSTVRPPIRRWSPNRRRRWPNNCDSCPPPDRLRSSPLPAEVSVGAFPPR